MINNNENKMKFDRCFMHESCEDKRTKYTFTMLKNIPYKNIDIDIKNH